MTLSRDFLLWLYRDRFHLTWTGLNKQPGWRIERDLAYMSLEAMAANWRARQNEKPARDRQFEAFKQRGRDALGAGKRPYLGVAG